MSVDRMDEYSSAENEKVCTFLLLYILVFMGRDGFNPPQPDVAGKRNIKYCWLKLNVVCSVRCDDDAVEGPIKALFYGNVIITFFPRGGYLYVSYTLKLLTQDFYAPVYSYRAFRCRTTTQRYKEQWHYIYIHIDIR